MIKSDNMDKPMKFVLPAPNFVKNVPQKSQPHYLTPCGMTLLTREKQPPAMYGPRGSTVPAKFLQNAETKPPEEPPKRQFCEPCEMELQSVEDFRRHRSQHERCPVEGCKFKGHPNVMDKHVTQFHASGLFDKIKKLSTPEEIAAWREERRRKYPTLANAKMRQLAQEQRERRGERLEQNKARFGRHEDRKRARANNSKEYVEKSEHPKRIRNYENNQRKGKHKRTNAMNLKEPAEKNTPIEKPEGIKEIVKENTDDIIVCGIKMFKGTSKMEDYKHEKAKFSKDKNVLSSLLGMYGSSDEEEDDAESDNNPCKSDEDNAKISSENIEPLKSDSLLKDVCIEQDLSENQIANNNHQIISQQKTEQNNTPIEQETLEASNEKRVLEIEEHQPKANKVILANSAEQEQEKHKTEPNGVEPIIIESLVEDPKIVPDEHQLKTDGEIDSVIARNEQGTLKRIAQITETTDVADKETKSNESSDEEPEEVPIQRTTTLLVINPSTSTESTHTNEEETIEVKRLRIEQSRKKLQDQRAYNLNIRKRKLRKQNTMLEKLLEPEIRHERNVLLQCVRFVCENNFFGIGAEPVSNNENVEMEAPSTS